MNDQTLIQSLCADLVPVRPRGVERQIAVAAVVGGAVSLTTLVSTLGIQPGLGTVSGALPLAIKACYALSFASLAFGATAALARPGTFAVPIVKTGAIIMAILASIAIIQFAQAPDVQTSSLLLGASWHSCSLRIAALSLPLLAGIGWALKRQAPVRLRQAGAAAGLAAGSTAAALYALSCTETSASFVLIWYSLGIAIATGFGALLGPRLLRW
jgi:hypothetical protein